MLGHNPQLYFGVVEDRKDPMMLGRCRVRILGVHNPNTNDLPTKDLPWAYPVTPITTAGVSGIGHSPTGPVEGTWVVIMFRDDAKQQPLMIGSIGGMPLSAPSDSSSGGGASSGSAPGTGASGAPSTEADVFADVKPSTEADVFNDGSTEADVFADVNSSTEADVFADTAQGTEAAKQQAVNAAANPNPKDSQIPLTPPPSTGDGLGSLSNDQLTKLKNDMAKVESGGRYDIVERAHGNYLGKYQMGAGVLESQGYLKPGTAMKYGPSAVQNSANWTGKDGITSKDAYLNNPNVQEKAMDNLLRTNYNTLGLTSSMDPAKTAGLLWVAHNQGSGAAKNFMATGAHSADGNGTSAMKNYGWGVGSVNGKGTIELPSSNSLNQPPADKNVSATDPSKYYAGASTPSSSSTNQGFKDPFNVYPRYSKEQDTNRLARGQNLLKTSLKDKVTKTTTGVPFANLKGKEQAWGQPLSPYNGKYPYNHVYMSESGHILEFDDSQGAERINLEHKSGTFLEIDVVGTQVNKIVGNGYTIYDNDGFIAVDGSCIIAVGADVSLVVAGSANIEVTGNTNLHCTGELNIEAEKQISIKTEKDIDIKCQDFNLTCNQVNFKLESSFEVTAESLIAGDAPQVKWNCGAAKPTEAEPEFRMYSPKLRPMKTSSFAAEQSAATAEQQIGIYPDSDGGPDGTGVPNGAKNNNGETITKDETPTNNKAEVVQPPNLNCDLNSDGTIANSTKLSTNVSVNDMVKSSQGTKQVKGQHGLSDKQVACNMQNLAVNVFEPIKEKYPEAEITSGQREAGVRAPTNAAGTPSKHETGEAIDIRFTGKSDAEVFAIAQDLKNTIPYDQLIYEQLDSGTTLIHVGLSPKAPGEVPRGDLRHLVYIGGKQTYPSGLVMRSKS